jgi:hypothetical protein
MRLRFIRHGQANFQWILVAAFIALAVVGSLVTLGTRTTVKLNQTATDVANPASLKNRFGS